MTRNRAAARRGRRPAAEGTAAAAEWDKLRARMLEHRVRQVEVADILGVNDVYLSRALTGTRGTRPEFYQIAARVVDAIVEADAARARALARGLRGIRL